MRCKMRRFCLWVYIFSLVFQLNAQTPEKRFAIAGEKYLNKDYKGAMELYLQILENGEESGELYYNMGNTAYRLGQIGEAVLYLEKARKFLPNDPDLDHNLAIVRQSVVDKFDIPEKPFYLAWFDQLKVLMSKPGIDLFISIWLVLIGMLWSAWYFFRGKSIDKILQWSGAGLTALWLGVFLLWNLGHIDRSKNQSGVLMTARAEVRGEPDDTAATQFILHEGAVFFVQRELTDWYEIELIDGKKGWILRESVAKI
jgi:tetratricopeptide (TPR) repeat protein